MAHEIISPVAQDSALTIVAVPLLCVRMLLLLPSVAIQNDPERDVPLKLSNCDRVYD